MALERGPLSPYYLLYGEETFLVERALALLRRRLAPPGRATTSRTLWADQDAERLPEALGDLRSPPLFGGSQVLVIRHAEALDDEVQERILDVLPALEAGGGLVLVGRSIDPRRRLAAACGRAGVAYAFPPLTDGRAVREWAVRLARERGHDIAPAAAEELVDRTGNDLGALASEVEKLSLHAGAGARIEPAHVRAVVAQVRTHALEELTDRLARRDLAGATRALRSLLAGGEPPIRLAAFLAANLRRALHVAELADAGLTPEQITQRLEMPAWLVRRNLGRGHAPDLIRALLALRRVDLELKSSRPAEATFENVLLEIAGR